MLPNIRRVRCLLVQRFHEVGHFVRIDVQLVRHLYCFMLSTRVKYVAHNDENKHINKIWTDSKRFDGMQQVEHLSCACVSRFYVIFLFFVFYFGSFYSYRTCVCVWCVYAHVLPSTLVNRPLPCKSEAIRTMHKEYRYC